MLGHGYITRCRNSIKIFGQKRIFFSHRVGQKNLTPACSKTLVLELILNWVWKKKKSNPTLTETAKLKSSFRCLALCFQFLHLALQHDQNHIMHLMYELSLYIQIIPKSTEVPKCKLSITLSHDHIQNRQTIRRLDIMHECTGVHAQLWTLHAQAWGKECHQKFCRFYRKQ